MNNKGEMLVVEIVLIILVMVAFVGLVILPFAVKPCFEAKVINAEYGTNYSGWDLMFSGRLIKKILEKEQPQRPEKKVIELNRPLVEVQL